ncbi:MAG: hypothetical protein RLZZ144_716 [Pseudomonadota bacterium]
MSWFFTNLIGSLLLPPLNLLILALVGFWYWRKSPRLARAILVFSIALLWLFSTPYVVDGLLQHLEGKPVQAQTSPRQAEAIVVLGGGTYFAAPEYGGDTLNAESLQRVRYAAKLYRETGLPVLVSGGKPLGNAMSEAQQMKNVLEQEFKVPVKWLEGDSATTFENAKFSQALLADAGIKRIYLVSHAWHLPRAIPVFEAVGLTVVPAPTAFTTRYQTDLLAFVPNAFALRDSRIYCHEMIGSLWYRLKSNFN